MSSELNYVNNPRRSRLEWGIFYVVLFTVLFIIFYIFIGRIRTHSLPSGQVELGAPYSQFLLGEPVLFTITNNFNSEIYAVNRCPEEPLGVYKLVNEKWVRIHARANKDCTDEDRRVSIPAHSTQSVSLADWGSLFNDVGKYRLVVFVEYYNALPYQDIEIINPMPQAQSSGSSGNSFNIRGPQQFQSNNTSQSAFEEDDDESNVPVIYTVHVNSSGNYDVTNLTLKRADSIRFIYINPGDEVRTRFTGSFAISSLTLDSEHTSGTRTFSSAGTWQYKADDHNGNTGTIVVQ